MCHQGCGRAEGVDHVFLRFLSGTSGSIKGSLLPVVRSGRSGCQSRFSLSRLSIWAPKDPSDWLRRETSALSPPTVDYRDSFSQSQFPSLHWVWDLAPGLNGTYRAHIMAATHSEYRGYLRSTVDMEAGPHRFHPVQSSEPTYRPLLFGTLAVMGLLQVASSVAILLHLTGYLQEVGSTWHCVVCLAFDRLCTIWHTLQSVIRCRQHVCRFTQALVQCVNIYLQILSADLYSATCEWRKSSSRPFYAIL